MTKLEIKTSEEIVTSFEEKEFRMEEMSEARVFPKFMKQKWILVESLEEWIEKHMEEGFNLYTQELKKELEK